MTEKKPPRIIFDATAEDRDALERVRASRGFRSHAETLRALIHHVDGEPEIGPYAPSRADLTGLSPRLPSNYAAVKSGLKPFTPHPKPGKK